MILWAERSKNWCFKSFSRERIWVDNQQMAENQLRGQQMSTNSWKGQTQKFLAFTLNIGFELRINGSKVTINQDLYTVLHTLQDFFREKFSLLYARLYTKKTSKWLQCTFFTRTGSYSLSLRFLLFWKGKKILKLEPHTPH